MPTDLTPDQLRRQGRADAVIRLVLQRVSPLLTTKDWCRLLDLADADVRAALTRLRSTHEQRHAANGLHDGWGGEPATVIPLKPRKYRRGDPVDCPTCGKTCQNANALAAHQRGHEPARPCPRCGKPIKRGGRHAQACPGAPAATASPDSQPA